MPFCKHVLAKVILVPFTKQLCNPVNTGHRDNKQCGHGTMMQEYHFTGIDPLQKIIHFVLRQLS